MSENQIVHKKSNARFLSLIIAALLLAVGIGYGSSLIGNGLAAKAGNAITVTGSARVNATSDNVVWTLNAQETAPNVATAVKKTEADVVALSAYLTNGGISAAGIESGAIATSTNDEYINGNATGRVLSYRANQTVIVRSKDVALVQKLSNGIGVLLQTGVNVNNYGPAYYVSNLATLRPSLLSDAMKDAKVRAQAITEAVGGTVGSVLAVRSGPVQVTTPDSVDTSSGGYYDTSTIEKTVTVTVSVDFKTS
ncbi:MAG: SIMPL domain-containing protein [Actinomycetes bacterium]